MRRDGRFVIRSLLTLLLVVSAARAQEDAVRARADALVHKHYVDGIQYGDAKALGREAVPYLLSLLEDPKEKPFWVNVIVTLGFIEDSSALRPLVAFLEDAAGEVDAATFRALLSVPFAVGCVASNGDAEAFDFLVAHARGAPARRSRWTFRGRDVDALLAEQGVVGLSVSGRPAARAELLRLRDELGRGLGPGSGGASHLLEAVRDGLGNLDTLDARGRAAVFNPRR